MSTSGGSGSGGLSVVTTHLTGAQIAQMFSSPHELIAAPGANRAVVMLGVEYETVAGVTSYLANDGGIYYDGVAAGALRIESTLNQLAMLGLNVPTSQFSRNQDLNPEETLTTVIANKAVNVTMPTADPARAGAIVTSTLAAGGAGYVIGDTGTIDSPEYGALAAYIVDTVGALGVVLTYHLTATGTGYDPSASPYNTTAAGAQPGIGTGLTLNVTAIPAPDGLLYVAAFYKTITTH